MSSLAFELGKVDDAPPRALTLKAIRRDQRPPCQHVGPRGRRPAPDQGTPPPSATAILSRRELSQASPPTGLNRRSGAPGLARTVRPDGRRAGRQCCEHADDGLGADSAHERVPLSPAPSRPCFPALPPFALVTHLQAQVRRGSSSLTMISFGRSPAAWTPRPQLRPRARCPRRASALGVPPREYRDVGRSIARAATGARSRRRAAGRGPAGSAALRAPGGQVAVPLSQPGRRRPAPSPAGLDLAQERRRLDPGSGRATGSLPPPLVPAAVAIPFHSIPLSGIRFLSARAPASRSTRPGAKSAQAPAAARFSPSTPGADHADPRRASPRARLDLAAQRRWAWKDAFTSLVGLPPSLHGSGPM